MKWEKSLIGLLGIGLIGLAGCNQGTPGGPGATAPNANKTIGQADETFRFEAPSLATNIKQGETRTVSVGIKRGKNFAQDVTVQVGDVPKGLKIEPEVPTIKSDDKETKLTVKADDNAAIGNFTIKLTGHPAKGEDATNALKVNVEKK